LTRSGAPELVFRNPRASVSGSSAVGWDFEEGRAVIKALQVVGILAGIASAGVAVATYFTKGGGGRHRDAPAAASSGPAQSAPAGSGSGAAETPRRHGGGDGGKK
jgi:hypothetical protein